jgi:5-methyltetrahydrofolate--homocysteine methyltransferase
MIKRYGAGVIVMAFDEQGQATNCLRRMEIFTRSLFILKDKLGFKEWDIVLDPNILTIATGMDEHNALAKGYIESCIAIRQKWPKVHISGGLSNLSFSFKGLNELRDQIHSVFLVNK